MPEELPIETSAIPATYSVSVRQLVEFVLRRGDLTTGDRTPRKLRARQGSVAHRKIQRSRPADFQTEVTVTHDIACPTFVLRILGRIDGLWKRTEGTLLEEIKTVKPSWNSEANPLHWAQLKVYGFIISQQQELAEIELQLTYFELESEQVTIFREKFTAVQMKEFFESVVGEYTRWLQEQEEWRSVRDASIAELQFPYGAFRTGQRALSAAVYKTAVNSGKLFAEAPTGIGKTMSVLFPTAKAMLARRIDRIFYLTAKTVTQSIAEKALADLKSSGLRFRTVTITAKEKVCMHDGNPCDILECPFAKNYYDRLKPALREALERETLTRPVIEEISRKHQLCPHEFSLDVSEWVDAIVCDYNHAFDPRASLKRHFSDNADTKVLLVDEAHNLLERARDMFSAELNLRDIADATNKLRAEFPKCANALRRLQKCVSELIIDATLPIVVAEIPEKLLKALETFTAAAEEYLGLHQQVDATLLESYYTATGFLQIADYFESFPANYRFILDQAFGGERVRLFCLDPSALLAELFGRVDAAVLFSATLTPLNYFRAALGGAKEDRMLKLQSPFAPENLKVIVAPYIQTAFRHRDGSLDELAASIAAFVAQRQGNYLVYFPSYKYLNELLPRLERALPATELLAQTQAMDDSERTAFLASFKNDRDRSLVGLAVMGGVFGEGIDLIGERLIGAVVVGVGLPQMCLERDLIRQHFAGQGMDGFAYAYVFPGFNRVLQAVGRVIRSESDRGAVMLIDSRFDEERFTELFPAWWNVTRCESATEVSGELQKFWSGI